MISNLITSEVILSLGLKQLLTKMYRQTKSYVSWLGGLPAATHSSVYEYNYIYAIDTSDINTFIVPPTVVVLPS